MPGLDYRQARATIRLADVLTLLGYQARTRVGPQLRGPCPLHQSRAATSRVFAAHLDKNMFKCFGCGAGGNALDFWAALTGQDLYNATLDLCRRLGQPVPWLPGRSTWKEKQPMPEP